MPARFGESAPRPRLLILTDTLPDPRGQASQHRLSLLLQELAPDRDLYLTVLASQRLHLKAWRRAQACCTALTVEPPEAARRLDLPISRTVDRWQKDGAFTTVIAFGSSVWPALRWFRQTLTVCDLATDTQTCFDQGGRLLDRAKRGKHFRNACATAERSQVTVVGTRAHAQPYLTRAGRTIIIPNEHMARLPEFLDQMDPTRDQTSQQVVTSRRTTPNLAQAA
ncbi:hypothetical protein [Mucisphaera sp.]|uniref:hypothetical protein n=1 Tax=Mucisphaera sp. TaxID=2913024 RepID=UPI003D0D85A6